MNFRHVIFKQILVIDGWDICCEIALIWMSLDFTDDQSTLVQIMAWCRQATSHYLSQCWPRSLWPSGVTRPQWVNGLICLPTFQGTCSFHHCTFAPLFLLKQNLYSHILNNRIYTGIYFEKIFRPIRPYLSLMVNWTLRNELQWKFNRNSYIFIQRKCIWKCHLEKGGHFVSASMC